MKVAVAYKDGEIFEHFGHAEMFAVYEYQGMDIDNCKKTLLDCSDRHGHAAMADLMKENGIDAVLVGNMGAEARTMLLSYGIVPIAGYCGDADTAADLLVEGRLPIIEGGGSCSGGCGGCSGCHHDEDGGDGECGCGGGCGCGC